MSTEDMSLPKPPSKAFGNRKTGETSENKPLMSDRIAIAAAEGKLEQFMKDEMPDSDHARKLVSMMMGMTGMMPPEQTISMQGGADAPVDKPSGPETEDTGGRPAVLPEDVLKAINTADVKGLKDLLKREYTKRSPGPTSAAEEGESQKSEKALAMVEKDVIDDMLKIASDNNLTPDWIILRALKLYTEEYNRTGRL